MAGKKGTKSNALAAMDQVATNQWIYGQRLRRAGIDQIAEMARQPAQVDEMGRYHLGAGLGRTISRSTVARRINEVLAEHRADLGADVAAQRALELDGLDAQARRIEDLVAQYCRNDETGDLERASWSKRLAAEAQLLRIAESRRKLLGLDAPQQVVVEATVTVVDSVATELGRMLDDAEADRKARR